MPLQNQKRQQQVAVYFGVKGIMIPLQFQKFHQLDLQKDRLIVISCHQIIFQNKSLKNKGRPY